MTSINTCRICHATKGESLSTKEMMYGTRQIFDYWLCHNCGCLQIATIPENLADYYRHDYYSYSERKDKGRWRQWRHRKKLLYAFDGRNVFGRLLSHGRREPTLALIGRLGLNRQARILDVGCGQGHLVAQLREIGFRNAVGLDPFIPAPRLLDGETLVHKAELSTRSDDWDLIMFHHSFEHLPDQQETLAAAKARLAPDGWLLLRIPTSASFAFETYREHWVQLDAPRHLYLHSRQSILLLAEEAGFTLQDMWDDSTAFQFWGSEQYRRDIALNASNSYAQGKRQSIFSSTEIKKFEKQAEHLNTENQGDQVALLLQIR